MSQKDVAKIKKMLKMQDAMNSKVNPKWKQANYEWYRAIWVECAEMLDHHGWKWWKQQKPDVEQVKLELVDIFHFGLSLRVVDGYTYDEISTALSIEMQDIWGYEDLKVAIESVAVSALTSGFDARAFGDCMQLVGMDLDELYRMYIGKNVLNTFRQNNGYKDGSYDKIWGGLEDNEVLIRILARADSDSEFFEEGLYRSLGFHYTDRNKPYAKIHE